MPSDQPERVFDPAEMQELRDQVRTLLANGEFSSQAEAARDSGIAYPTFSAWVGNKYTGNNDNVATLVERWLKSRETRKRTLALAVPAVKFVATPTAEAIMTVLAQAQHLPDFVTVTGAPGVGKTMAACRYTRENPHVTKIVASPSLQTASAVLWELCHVTGVPTRGRPHMMLRGLVGRLRDRRALIIVDEANHLTTAALEQLRAVHDQAEVGVALVGNPRIHGRLAAEGGQDQNAQISRRIGIRLQRHRPLVGDINALINAWGVDGEAEKKLLRAVAHTAGALGRMTKTLRMAHLMAAQEGKPIDVAVIQQACDQLDVKVASGEAA